MSNAKVKAMFEEFPLSAVASPSAVSDVPVKRFDETFLPLNTYMHGWDGSYFKCRIFCITKSGSIVAEAGRLPFRWYKPSTWSFGRDFIHPASETIEHMLIRLGLRAADVMYIASHDQYSAVLTVFKMPKDYDNLATWFVNHKRAEAEAAHQEALAAAEN